MSTAIQERTEPGKISYVAPSESYWILEGVKHRGENQTYRVFEQMTPPGTQDDLIEKYGLQIPNSQLVWALTERDYELRNSSPNEAEQLRNFLKQGFRKYPNTSSRIIYTSQGEDKVIHNVGTSDEYPLYANVVGVDGLIKDIPDKKVLESILGTYDVEKINEVSQWVNGTDSHIWRLNSKPKQEDTRVVGFDALGGRLGFDCYRVLSDEDPAFRVERIK